MESVVSDGGGPRGDGQWRCEMREHRDLDLTIDGDDAAFPMMKEELSYDGTMLFREDKTPM